MISGGWGGGWGVGGGEIMSVSKRKVLDGICYETVKDCMNKATLFNSGAYTPSPQDSL